MRKKIQEAYFSIIPTWIANLRQFASNLCQFASNLRLICVNLHLSVSICVQFVLNLCQNCVQFVSICVQLVFLHETLELILIDKPVGPQQSGQGAAMQCVLSAGASAGRGAGRPQTPMRIARTAVEHAALIARNIGSNHADMQDKYCGESYGIHPIQSHRKGNHKRGGAAEGRATSFVVAAAGRGLCICTSCSSPLEMHVLPPFRQCAKRFGGPPGPK